MGAAARARVVAPFALREQVDETAKLLRAVAAEGVPRVRSTAGIRVLDGARQRAGAAD